MKMFYSILSGHFYRCQWKT